MKKAKARKLTEFEANDLLALDNNELEKMISKRTSEIVKQKEEKEEKEEIVNKKITKSVKLFTTGLVSVLITLTASAATSNIKTIKNVKENGVELSAFDKNIFGVPYSISHPNFPINVCIKDDFSLDAQGKIINAIEKLDEVATGLNYKYKISDNYNPLNTIVIKLNEKDENKSNLGFSVAYQKNFQNQFYAKINYPISISINPMMKDSPLLTKIVQHELLHTLGFADLTDSNKVQKTIMMAYVSEMSNDYTEEDIKNINAMYPEK